MAALCAAGYTPFVGAEASPPGHEEEQRAAPCAAGTAACLRAPDPDEALRELYGVRGNGGGAQLANHRTASVAVAKPIERHGGSYFLFIAEVREAANPGHRSQRRFGRGVRVGALVYRRNGAEWQVAAKAPFVAEFGQPGQFGGGWEPEDSDLVEIGPNKLALLLCTNFLLPGLEGSRGALFELRGNVLSRLGYLELSEHNSKSCARTEVGRLLFGNRPRCYGYEGRLKPLVVAGADYYDLVIEREGTVPADPEPSATGGATRSTQAAAAAPLVYRYRDGAYRLAGETKD